MPDPVEARLGAVVRQYDAVQANLALPEVSADPEAIRRLGRELSRLEPVVETWARLHAVRDELVGAREMRLSGEVRRRLGGAEDLGFRGGTPNPISGRRTGSQRGHRPGLRRAGLLGAHLVERLVR